MGRNLFFKLIFKHNTLSSIKDKIHARNFSRKLLGFCHILILTDNIFCLAQNLSMKDKQAR